VTTRARSVVAILAAIVLAGCGAGIEARTTDAPDVPPSTSVPSIHEAGTYSRSPTATTVPDEASQELAGCMIDVHNQVGPGAEDARATQGQFGPAAV